MEIHKVDLHVGHRIRMTMAARGVTQEKLGKALGVTFQQVQKYVNGTNRVSASKLYEIANVLRVSPSYFFEGLTTHDDRDLFSKEAIRLARKAEKLSTKQKNAVVALVEALGNED